MGGGGMGGGGMGGGMGFGRGGMGGGYAPYGYGNMMPMNNRPRFNNFQSRPGGPRGMGGPGNMGGPGGGVGRGPLTVEDVRSWLNTQQPFVLQNVMKHCSNLLTNKHGQNKTAFQDWYKEDGAAKKTGTLLEGGVEGGGASKTLKRDLAPKQGWTKSDMRHPHKVVHQMKPLPEVDIIPPFSAENKEADVDRDKRKMLQNNVNMMQIEVNKICHKFKIIPSQLDRENLDQYPENSRAKLKTAVTCVKNAERTLSDFLEFLKSEKYREWNDEQTKQRESLLKSMIGETPKGTPHASGIREEDIELVERKFEDGAGIPEGFAGLPDEEKTLDELEGEPAEPVEKAAKKEPIKFAKSS